jgi:hypothetical protein
VVIEEQCCRFIEESCGSCKQTIKLLV